MRLPGDPALTDLLKPLTLENSCLENSCRSPPRTRSALRPFACGFSSSGLMLNLCRMQIALALTIVITVPFLCYYTVELVGTLGILSPFRWYRASGSSTTLSCEAMSTRPAVQCERQSSTRSSPLVSCFRRLHDGQLVVVGCQRQECRGSAQHLPRLPGRPRHHNVLYPLLRCTAVGFDFRDASLAWAAGMRVQWAMIVSA